MTRPPFSALELRVLTGLHAGAALPMIDEPIVLGSDSACDVILLDTGIQPVHLRMICTEDGYLLHPEDGALISDLHGEPVADGARAELGIPMQVGQVWITLSDPDSPWQEAPAPGTIHPSTPDTAPNHPVPKDSARTRPRLASLWVGLVCAAALATWGAWRVWGLHPEDTPPPRPVETPAAISPTPPPPPAQTQHLEPAFVERETGRMLRDRELQEVVRLDATPGRLYMEADLDKAETVRFENALLALNRQFGAKVRIDAKVTPLTHSVPFVVREVVWGTAAHVTLSDGRRIYEGGSADGFRLAAIRPGKLIFVGRRRVELPW